MLLTHRFKPKRKTTRLRPRVDGRTLEARRYRQLVRDLTAELGGSLSTIEAALIGQAAALVVKSEIIQAQVIAGESSDSDEAIRLASESRRLLDGLRSKAKTKPAENALQEYLDAHYGGANEEASA
jgi:hypothetical protein